jgi:hypothetical protein
MNISDARGAQLRGRVGSWLASKLGLPSIEDYTQEVVNAGPCLTALDVGCGASSHLTRFRGNLRTFGVDVDAGSIDSARASNVHDDYILANLIETDIDELSGLIEAKFGFRKFDLVTAYGVIEHVPKDEGWKLLKKCEALSDKFVLFETPNGFVEQGPEFGNPFQRHLSGWYANDFRGLGFTVLGTSGTRHLSGYMGDPKVKFPGAALVDKLIVSRLLRANVVPEHAFNLVAIKDVRGVPARYASREERFRKG